MNYGKVLDRSSNPVFGPQPFKLGLFSYLHDGGNALSTYPGRWRARWDDIAELARMADEGGLDFMMPIARWRGVEGSVEHRLWNYETLTSAAVLAGMTKRIGVFATVHVPLVHPIFAAKSLITIDHASHGRAGVNIVCGWNQEDFDMFGMKVLEHDDRYQQGDEWFEIMKHLFRGDGQEVDFDTRYYPAHKGVVGRPGSVQRPYPAIISAAFSPRGRDFAVRHSDFLMLGHLDADGNTKEIDDINARSAAVGRAEPPGIICSLAPFIRETREEAEAYFRDFAIDHADPVAIGNYFRLRDTNAARALVENDVRAVGAASGGNPVVGTPRDLVEALLRIRKQGYSGATFTLPHFTRDLPLIIEKAIPLMEEAGLRIRERSPAAAPA